MARFLEDDDDNDHSGEKRSFLWRRGDMESETRGRRMGVIERVFGICKADPKEGREASNVIHPQSPFATGSPPRPHAPHPPCTPARTRTPSHVSDVTRALTRIPDSPSAH